MEKKTRRQQSPNRIFNILNTLKYIREHGRVGVTLISEKTGMTLPTLYRTIKYLLDKNIIIEDGKGESLAGRKAQLYKINNNYKYTLGVILEKQFVRSFIADMGGAIRVKFEISLIRDLKKQEILDIINETIRQAILKFFGSDDGLNKIETIGVLVSGSIDANGSIIEFGSRECLNGFDILPYMENMYTRPVKLMKTSSIEALAYATSMREQNVKNYVYIHIGAGIGACIVINGNIYEGEHGYAGEIENYFNLKMYNSIVSNISPITTVEICEKILEYIENNPYSKLAKIYKQQDEHNESKENKTIYCINEALAISDKACIKLMDEIIRRWAMLIMLIAACYDPEVCIIGGEISDQVSYVFNWLKDIINESGTSLTKYIPADSKKTMDYALIISVLDDIFANIREEIKNE